MSRSKRQLNINNFLNDDMLRIILSFLTSNDLLRLNLVSKSARFCQLCHEDFYWKPIYYQTIQNYIDSSKESDSYDVFKEKFEYLESVCENYRENLLKFLETFMKQAQQEENDLISYVDELKSDYSKENVYIEKEEIEKYQPILSNPSKIFKIIGVGDDQVGKTSFFITISSGIFPSEYIPQVFDNYSYSIPRNQYSIGYW